MSKLQKTLFMSLVLPLILLGGCSKPPALTDPAAGAVSEPAAQGTSSSEEEPAPVFVAFEGTDLEGNAVSEDIFLQSKLTMVNIWATYCNPCLNEMPGLGELASEYDRSEFQIIGIVSDVREGEDQTPVEELVRQTGADYPHLLANDSIDQAFLAGVSGVPTTFFFDGEGACLGGVVGSAEKTQWEELIHGLLEES